MASETSDDNISFSSDNKQNKPKFTYSTDYHPEFFQDSNKMIPENERIAYTKPNNNNSNIQQSLNNQSNIQQSLNNQSKDDDDELSEFINPNNNSINNNSINNNSINNNSFNNLNNDNLNNNLINNNLFANAIKDNNNTNNNTNNTNNTNNNPEDEDDYNTLSDTKKILKRLDILRKLGELSKYGVKLSQNYNINSDYFTMKYEYELHRSIRAKQNSVNWMSSIMLNCIYGMEILNDKYNPFELKLTGWAEQINADMTNYYDVFGEIYEKYNKPGKNMSPELKLIFMLGGSALKFHLNNALLSQPNKINSLNNNNNINYNNNNNNPLQPIPNPNYPVAQPNQDSVLLEKLRQQAIADRLKQEKEALQQKANLEHEQAIQQMKDLAFLQQKKEEQDKINLGKNKQLQELQQIKNFLETNDQFQSTTYNLNNINNQKSINPDNIRKENIINQLNNIKNNINNSKKKKDGLSVDTSSTSSSSNKSKSETSIVESLGKNNKAQLLSRDTIDQETSELKPENKSNVSKSTFSRRKYKRGISIAT
jgi:hypothetical protein